ncbi:nucleoside hydrolase [Lentzea albidocapillata]|uniref:Pyrimidine-specific ribonucleoside hydrolase n=2 Tax=Lentzea albidocapillata TaxID=40571 RepID=A0A1W2DVF4_9PSEU|nr:nucleoside hydrolase [Lentzea albidocapillata]SDL48958.1 pyrimidine-specific ribonucleoside hydrolase [Lentzea albidocapillata subsp. violacea]SMD01470.1 pyrimidine-specific ribonucleoside hydrolase [Lentzea albidocapillata]
MAHRLIIDTDPGVDDAFAIALAARSPEVELVGLTTVFGNVGLDLTTRNAQRLLAYLGRTDVPVVRGAEGPGGAADVHGEDGLGGQAHTLPESDTELFGDDVTGFFRERLTPETVVVAIGPQTNIARALDAGVEFPRLIVMGGGLDVGNTTARAEFNFWADPQAARTVIRKANPIVVPLNLTHRCIADAEFLAKVDQTLSNLTGTYRAYLAGRSENEGIYVHDAVAVAEAIIPGTLKTTTHLLDVDDEGALVEGKHQVEVAEDCDWPALRAFMEQRLSV